MQLDPNFGKRRDKLFVTGGPAGQLFLNRRNWFAQRDLVLHEGEVRARGSSSDLPARDTNSSSPNSFLWHRIGGDHGGSLAGLLRRVGE